MSATHRAERDRAELDRTEQQRRAVLIARVQELSVALGRAQADGALTVEQDGNLQELLADASAPTTAGDAPELAGIRRNLDQVAALLPRYREEAASRLRARLAELPEVSPEDREHVQRALDTDNLATAAELVYFLELGEPVPEVRSQDSHLEAFFPDVPRALPAGITPKLVATVRNRRRWSGSPRSTTRTCRSSRRSAPRKPWSCGTVSPLPTTASTSTRAPT
ncbi:hypothetical protein [Streptomyces decoyicus]|uniref:hypothetical protein n=1 Tax=Streptomyces decoyicus TaxID=249567 RepID=UPI0033A3A095